jgi:predicted amidohydrolase
MSAPTTFIAAAVQFGARLYEAEANRARAEEAIRAAAAQGARLIVLPELVVPGYGLDAERLAALAEPLEGATLAAWRGLARTLGVVIAGGFCERFDGRLYNSAVLVTPAGTPTLYRKLHLFDAEKEVFAPGDRGLPVVETPLGYIGLCVCYDLRFIEVARGLALAGADILAVPTAWVGGFDRAPRDAMGFIGQARGAVVQANLDQVAMVCASQAGCDQGIRFLGSSLIVDSFGECLAGPMGENEEATLTATLDVAAIRASHVRSPRVRPREDRRRDVYGLVLSGRTY